MSEQPVPFYVPPVGKPGTADAPPFAPVAEVAADVPPAALVEAPHPAAEQVADAGRPADAEDASAQIAEEAAAIAAPPPGAELLLPLTGIPWERRKLFWEAAAAMDIDGLSDRLAGLNELPAMAQMAAMAGLCAQAVELLGHVTRPALAVSFEQIAASMTETELMALLGWYFKALTPGEAQPSLT